MTDIALPTREDDRGFTMTELIVAMGLLTVFMAMFTTATLMMTNTTAKVQRISTAVTQANQAFLALDRSVRYATGISPHTRTTSGVWHVEFSRTEASNGASKDICTQLRVTNKQLQQRSWTVSGAGYSNLSVWRPLADNVTNGDAVAPSDGTAGNLPFFLVPSGSSLNQRLTVTIISAGSESSTTETNRASMTFSAVNSTAGATSSICQQVSVEVAS